MKTTTLERFWFIAADKAGTTVRGFKTRDEAEWHYCAARTMGGPTRIALSTKKASRERMEMALAGSPRAWPTPIEFKAN